MQRYVNFEWLATILIITALLTSVATTEITITTTDPNGKTITIPYRDPPDEADAAIKTVLSEYRRSTSDLIRKVKNPKTPNMQKVKYIYALGELRALRATSGLIENINFVATRPDPVLHLPRWRKYPAREALVKIGRYASTMIMDIIGGHKFDEEKVDGYAAVLAEIERPRYALMKLKERAGQAKDDKSRKQYETVIARLKSLADATDRPQKILVEEKGFLISNAVKIKITKD